jgi:hypothetical protein
VKKQDFYKFFLFTIETQRVLIFLDHFISCLEVELANVLKGYKRGLGTFTGIAGTFAGLAGTFTGQVETFSGSKNKKNN